MLVTLYEKATGELGPVVSCSSEAELAAHLSDAIHYVEGHHGAGFCVDPSTGEVIADTTVDMDALREAATIRVRKERDDRLYSGCDTPHGVVDTDKADRIGRAANAAMAAKLAGQSFSITWIMQDGSEVALDADGVLALNAAVVAHFDVTQRAASAAKVAIATAGTADELDAITGLGAPELPVRGR